MRVAQLQGARRLSHTQTYLQIGSSRGTQNACIGVSSQCIEVEKDAVGFPEVLEMSAQETHVPRHAGSCHPPYILRRKVRVLRVLAVKGGELTFAKVVVPPREPPEASLAASLACP